MTEPNDPTPESTPGRTSASAPDGTEATQAIPRSETQAMPTSYGYPGGGDGAAATTPGATTPEAATPQATGSDGPAAAGVPFSEPTAPTGPRRRTGLVAGGAVAVLVLGGGIAFGVAKLSGGGAQPADVIPSDALAYARIDIDPSAGQKIAAVRFLNKIPAAKDAFSSDDLRQKLWEQAITGSNNACLSKFDFAKDIKPWLGERAGLAVRPGKTDGEPNMVVVLQTSDEAKARDTLGRLIECSDDSKGKTDIRARDGYVLLTPKGQGDATLSALDKGSLAGNATFSGDMTALGDQGIASMWFDVARVTQAVNDNLGAASGQSLPQGVQGRAALTLRFDPSFVEVAGVARGNTTVKKVAGSGAELASLPTDTVAALQLSGGAQQVDDTWPELQKALNNLPGVGSGADVQAMLENELGIKLPDDLKVLLGKSFTVALPDQEFGSSDLPTVGLKVTGTDAKRAEEVLTSIEDVSGGALALEKKSEADRLYASTTPGYADKLGQPGKLGDSDGFKAALGDTTAMAAGVYVDLDRVEKYYLDTVSPDAREAVESLRAVGLSLSHTGEGESTFSLRVVGN